MILIEWIVAFAIFLIGIKLLDVYLKARSRANSAIIAALDVMERKWLKLSAEGSGAPEDVLEFSCFVARNVRDKHWRAAMLRGLTRPSDVELEAGKSYEELVGELPEDLRGDFMEYVGASFIVVANGNLFYRILLRAALGRFAERNGGEVPVKYVAVPTAYKSMDAPNHCLPAQ